MWSAFIAMIYRQLKRWTSSRSRLIATIIQPLLWLTFLGLGFGGVFNPENIDLSKLGVNVTALPVTTNVISRYFTGIFGGVDYVTYLVSGMVAMTAFMGSFIAGISVIWDKQFGFLKETLVTPAPRSAVILGRIVGDALVNTIHSTIIVTLALLFTKGINVLGIPLALLYIFLMSLGFTSLGIVLSLKFQSAEGFQVIVNILTMPLMFASGVFYPVSSMPDWMKWFAVINPLTYATHASRYWLTRASTGFDFMNPFIDALILGASALILLWLAAKTFEKTTIED